MARKKGTFVETHGYLKVLDCDSSYFGMSVRDFGKLGASRTSPSCASWSERGSFQTTKMDEAGHG